MRNLFFLAEQKDKKSIPLYESKEKKRENLSGGYGSYRFESRAFFGEAEGMLLLLSAPLMEGSIPRARS